VTLAECAAGERVFAEMFVDVSAPRLWDLIEIVE
jgi:hypothetical protein